MLYSLCWMMIIWGIAKSKAWLMHAGTGCVLAVAAYENAGDKQILPAIFCGGLSIISLLTAFTMGVREHRMVRQQAQEREENTERAIEEGLKTIVFESKPKTPRDDGTEEEEECSICLEQFEDGEELAVPGCGHLFHPDCLKEWVKTDTQMRCPVCRYDILDGVGTDNQLAGEGAGAGALADTGARGVGTREVARAGAVGTGVVAGGAGAGAGTGLGAWVSSAAATWTRMAATNRQAVLPVHHNQQEQPAIL
jgi:hypothetical protein